MPGSRGSPATARDHHVILGILLAVSDFGNRTQGTFDLFWAKQIAIRDLHIQGANRTQWRAIAKIRKAEAGYASVLSQKFASIQSVPNVAMQGARRRQWQALVKLRNVAVTHSGRSLRAGQKRPWTGVALVRIGDGQSFTRALWPETFLIPLNQCELLTQDTRCKLRVHE
jgi:hypothetical protein